MPGNKSESLRQRLRDRLRAVITSEFESLSAASAAAVLEEVAGELKRPQGGVPDPQKTRQGGWSANLADRMAQPFVPEGTGEVSGLRHVRLQASGAEQVANLLHQALEVGAVFVRFGQAPNLNDTVSLEIGLPDSHLSVETHGRVVHSSGRGTAIELSQLSREDRAALAAIYADHREHLSEAAVSTVYSDQSESSAGAESAASAPSAEPSAAAPGKGRVDPAATFDEPLLSREATSEGSFGREDRPPASVTLGGFGGRAPTGFTMRRRVELTDPDVRVITSTQQALRTGRELEQAFGPEVAWTTPTGEADRVEKLDKERILDILLQVSESGLTGIMEIASGDEQRQLYLDGGLVVQVALRPRKPSQELGPMLHMADRITEEQLAMAATHADENRTSLERSLLDLEILDHDAIRHAIAGRLTYLVREVAEIDDGEVRIYTTESLPAGFLPMPPLRVHVPIERITFKRLFERLRSMGASERDAVIADHLDTYPEVIATDRDRLERALGNEKHQRLFETTITGRKRLREVFTESNLSPAETFALVYALHRMGILRFDTSLHQTIVRERYRENVTVKYLSVHKASYFEVLNVHWSSYDEVVAKAYYELKEQFDPAKVPEHMEPEVHQRVKEIHERVEAAYQVLAKRKTRHAYRKRIMPEYKLAHAVPLFMKQAELAERRDQLQDARDGVLRVLEIDPEDAAAARKLDELEDQLAGNMSASVSESF